jgi:hypothetical protein
MSKLSAEANAIIEGRHSDPFRYLGLHKEGDETVVRAFLPEAHPRSKRSASVAMSPRLRAFTMRACSPAHCRTAPNATSCAPGSATTSSISKTPIAFHPF